MKVTLSVLSGLHRGAVAHFTVQPSGNTSIVIGSDAFNTDITLLDPGIQPVHWRLTADKKGLYLNENNGNTPLSQGARDVQPGDYILYGKPFECAGISLAAQCVSAAKPFYRRKAVIAASFIILIILTILVFFSRPPTSSTLTERFLSTEPYRCLSWEIMDKQLIISGFVTTSAEKKLLSFFKQQDISYRLSVITPDTEQQKLNDWLNSRPNNHLTAELSNACGHLEIQGIRAPHQQDVSLTDVLPAMLMSSEESIDDNSTITDEYIKKLDSLINTLQLNSVILDFTFSAQLFSVTLSKSADNTVKKQLHIFLDKFNQDFKFNYQLDIRVQPVNKPKLVVRAISLGRVPYVILHDGKKYQAGSAPDKDTRIISINKEQMVLLYKNERYTITFTDDKK